MKVSRRKLGFDADELVEVIGLRFDKGAALDFAASNDHVLPGYHMNKNSWITVLLDDGMPTRQLLELVDYSYNLVLQ